MRVEMEEQPAATVAEKMAPALISVHPQAEAVVVAIGAGLRVFDLKNLSSVTTRDSTTPARHGEAIRTVAFNKQGNLFASAGDDKLVKLWNTESWTCIKTTRVAKKVTGVNFTLDSKWLLFADKFGVVFVLPTSASELPDQPVQLLAHCCSIISDLKPSPDGKYVITSDRDFKVRVSVLPAVPTKGAHEIWSYCLGHANFVTCFAFVGEPGQKLLVSGSGDATVRLWNYETGALFDTFLTSEVIGEPSEDGNPNGNNRSEEENPNGDNRAVMGVSVSPDGDAVAVILERFQGVLLLRLDSELKTLRCLQILALVEFRVYPTSVVFDRHSRLWLVGGAAETVDSRDWSVTPEESIVAESRAHDIARTAVAHVKLIQVSSPSTDVEPNLNVEAAAEVFELCETNGIPGGEELLQALQGSNGRVDIATEEVALAAKAAELAMRKLMSKREYTMDQRDYRKRMRNDKKLENKTV